MGVDAREGSAETSVIKGHTADTGYLNWRALGWQHSPLSTREQLMAIIIMMNVTSAQINGTPDQWPTVAGWPERESNSSSSRTTLEFRSKEPAQLDLTLACHMMRAPRKQMYVSGQYPFDKTWCMMKTHSGGGAECKTICGRRVNRPLQAIWSYPVLSKIHPFDLTSHCAIFADSYHETTETAHQ